MTCFPVCAALFAAAWAKPRFFSCLSQCFTERMSGQNRERQREPGTCESRSVPSLRGGLAKFRKREEV